MPITEKTCKICGHKWYPRKPGKPIVCPKCKNTGWDKGRVRKVRDRLVQAAQSKGIA